MKSLGKLVGTTTFFVPLLASLTLLPSTTAQAQHPSFESVGTLITDQKTVIPGHVLSPGNYSVRIIDHLKDRFIVQVNDVSGGSLATFIGVHNPDFTSSIDRSQHGPVFWNSAPKGEAAIRGFSFPNGNTLEFVYPKLEAVTLATLNTNTVPAIDPASEGRKPDPKLSREDREIVTLWLLTPTRVGTKADTPAIAAKRFVAPIEGPESKNASVEVASLTPPPALSSKRISPSPVRIAKAEPAQAPRIHSSVKALPQTASDLPLILSLSFLSLLAAAVLRFTRIRA